MLGNRKFYKEILCLGFPVSAQMLLSSSLSFVDSLMVGSMGETALAAVGASTQFGNMLSGFNWGLCCGGVLFMSQYHGVKDDDGIRRAFGLTLSLMTTLALLCALTAFFFPYQLAGLYAEDLPVRQLAQQYLRIISFSYIIQAISTALSNMLNATERVKISLIAAIASIFTNTFLNWVLIYGKLGMPAYGVRGAAIASLTAAVVNALVLLGVCIYQRNIVVTHIDRMIKWPRWFVKEYIRKTWPLFINEVGYSSAYMIIFIVFGRQGEGNMAAVSIFRTIEGLLYTFFQGLSSSSSVMVGKRVGAGEIKDAVQYAHWFMILCPILSLALCMLVLLFRGPILSLFEISDGVRSTIVQMILVFSVLGPMRHCNYIQNNIFRAGGEPRVGTILELSGIWMIAVPATLLAGFVLKAPFFAVFAASMIDECIKLPISVCYMLRNGWIKPVTEQGRAAMKALKEKT